MRIELAYDASFDPAAPFVPATVEGPGDRLVAVRMLLDTGADCTLLPVSIVRQLRLPVVDRTTITGVAGGHRQATVHAARLALGDIRLFGRVVAFADEAILGRDLLEHVVVQLHGPQRRLVVSGQRGASGRSSRRRS